MKSCCFFLPHHMKDCLVNTRVYGWLQICLWQIRIVPTGKFLFCFSCEQWSKGKRKEGFCCFVSLRICHHPQPSPSGLLSFSDLVQPTIYFNVLNSNQLCLLNHHHCMLLPFSRDTCRGVILKKKTCNCMHNTLQLKYNYCILKHCVSLFLKSSLKVR